MNRITLAAALAAAYALGTIAPHAHAATTESYLRDLVSELRGIRQELGQLRSAVERGHR